MFNDVNKMISITILSDAKACFELGFKIILAVLKDKVDQDLVNLEQRLSWTVI